MWGRTRPFQEVWTLVLVLLGFPEHRSSLFVLGEHVVEDVEELVSVVLFEDESGTEADGLFAAATQENP